VLQSDSLHCTEVYSNFSCVNMTNSSRTRRQWTVNEILLRSTWLLGDSFLQGATRCEMSSLEPPRHRISSI